ncbi:MAG TPA: hypothetical protein VK462_01655 [Nitrososphaeraceae archaeon]|nr:hypothetical protein [Nitrososphaeraceae archaeon]
MIGLTLGEVKNRALKLMDEWSLQGVRESGDFIADYQQKFNVLVDMAQQEISDHVGIYATYTITPSTVPDVVTTTGLNKYLLPPDLKDFRYVRVDDAEIFTNYRIEDGYFIISQDNSSTFTLHYFRYPTTIDDTTPDTYLIEVDNYVQDLIPYYLAGTVLMSASEDTQLSDKLLNTYYLKLKIATKREIRYPRRARQTVRW